MNAVIETKDLSKHYGPVIAVDRLTLTLPKGEVFGLLGPNGSGKTTTILMLLGLTDPTAGTVRVLGHDPSRNPLEVKRRVGYLPDSVGFYDELTARENLRYTARLNGLPRPEAETRITEVLGLEGTFDSLADQVLGGAYRIKIETSRPDGLEPALRAIPGVTSLSQERPGQFKLETQVDCRAEVARRVVSAGVDLLGLALERPSLDEVYARYFRKVDHEA